MPTRFFFMARVFGRCLLRFFVILVLMEILLRILGYGPAYYQTYTDDRESVFLEDPQRGWIMRPNVSRVTDGVRYTTLSDGSRSTSRDPLLHERQLILAGCSFTNGGLNLSDEDTFAWKLQSRLDGFQVKNYGALGYSTVQTLMDLKIRLKQSVVPPVIIYGFVSFHEIRNVSDPIWIRDLSRLASREVRIPYGSLSNGKLDIRAPDHWSRFPLDSLSALSTVFEDLYGLSIRASRLSEKEEVTLQAIEQMRDLSKASGAQFKVAFLHAVTGRKEYFLPEMQRRGIDVIDCTFPGDLAAHALPVDRHPDGVINSFWAQCIAKDIEGDLKKS